MVCINESAKGCGWASSLEVRLGSQRSIFVIEDDNRWINEQQRSNG
jgi:hypothetical protein